MILLCIFKSYFVLILIRTTKTKVDAVVYALSNFSFLMTDIYFAYFGCIIKGHPKIGVKM